MKKILTSALIISSATLLLASDRVAALADEKCGKCHLMGTISKEQVRNIQAPPYWGMAKKVREAFPSRHEQIEFIVDYTFNPSEDKMLFPQATKKMFGLMPSQKGNVTEDELREIAEHFLGN